MSANSARHGTTHFKIHSWTGWGVIIGLIPAIISVLVALPDGADGILGWLGSPHGALGMIAFLTAAFWYCKLEMDEVINDYFGGGMRQFGLLANKLAAFTLWAISVAALVVTAFF